MLEETFQEFEGQSVELILAGNGMKALEAIRQYPPELVFLDVLMPKMNGLEVCDAAKNQLGPRMFTSLCSPPRDKILKPSGSEKWGRMTPS